MGMAGAAMQFGGKRLGQLRGYPLSYPTSYPPKLNDYIEARDDSQEEPFRASLFKPGGGFALNILVRTWVLGTR